MCGIAVIVSEALAGAGRAGPAVGRMLALMRHRGPDGEGVAVSGRVALGAVRLAVIDTRPVAQPLASHDGRHLIAFNGEVYRHDALRRELEGRHGARFVTRTDTEVVLEAFRAWGPACLDRFDGMFAFVILDTETGEVFGARDRMGKKPLFVHASRGLFAFASFLPAFAAVPALSLTIDSRAVLDVVEQGYVLHPRTMFAEVDQIPPAHAFTLRGDRLEVRPWWDLSAQFRDGMGLDERAITRTAEEVEHALDEAVAARMVADVPVGAFLSGGLDSSIVTSLMTRHGLGRVRTFTAGFDDADHDESAEAASVARALGTEHRCERMRLADPDQLRRIVALAGEPLADTSLVPTALVAEVASHDVTVVLSGDGADELFAGYETFRADRVRAWLAWLPQWPLPPLARIAARAWRVDDGKVSLGYRARTFASGLDLPFPLAHARWRALRSHDEALALLAPDARAAVGATEHAADRFRELDASVAGCDPVNRASYLDLMTYLPDDILVKLDRATMMHPVEARAPFLDRRVVELAARLPGRYKLRGFTTKWLLRRQFASLVPRSSLRRRKQGFSAPVARWLRTSMRDMFCDMTTPERLAPLGLDAARVRQEHAALLDRTAYNGYKLWAVLALALWKESVLETLRLEQAP